LNDEDTLFYRKSEIAEAN